MDPEFLVSTDRQAGWLVVSAIGEIDMATAPRLRDALRQAGAEPHLVVDLSRVSFMDSSALRVLVDAHRSVADLGGELRVVVATARVEKVLELSGLTRVLSVYNSVATATAGH